MQKRCPDLSVVIVSYRTCDLLRRCLQSVFANTPCHFEVIIVDNNSDDGSAEMVEREFPDSILVRNKRNLGFAAANNRGFRYASGRYIALLNPDTELTPGALDRAIAFLDKETSVGLVGCQLLNADGSLQPSAGASEYSLTYGLFRLVMRSLLLDKLLGKYRPDWVYPGQLWLTPAQHQTTRDVKHVMGACMVVRKEVVEQVGGLDEDYFILMEETDWCYRIRKSGWRVVYLPQARVYHVRGASMAGTQGFLDRQYAYHMYRGRLLFFKKHKGNLQASLYKGLLLISVILRIVPRVCAAALGIEPAKHLAQAKGLLRALELVNL